MDALPPGTDLSKIPFMPSPSGSPPDFEHGPSLEPVVLGTGAAFVTISGILLGLRLFTGLEVSRRLFADDWLCILGEIVGVIQWALLYIMTTRGLARHSWDVPITVMAEQLQLANQMLAAITHFAVKASIVFFLLRLFGTLRWVRLTCYLLLGLTFLSYTSYEVVALIYCVPRPGESWDSILMTRCASSAPATIAVGICSVLADLVLFVLPFPIIANLTLSRSKKKGLVIVFLLGLLVLITSVVGLVYRFKVSYDTTDPLWHGGNLAIAAYMEAFGTVIVACIPSLPGLWNSILTKTSFYSTLRRSGGMANGITTTTATATSRKHSYHHPPDFPLQKSQSSLAEGSSQRNLIVRADDGGREYHEGFPLRAIQKTTTSRVSSSRAGAGVAELEAGDHGQVGGDLGGNANRRQNSLWGGGVGEDCGSWVWKEV
ncbi:hypothetical protein QBC35DRAFT_377485 [Podospora australis]|uniref:Rhodopsin domain-containing protein n=1 Tax=Podospora australis TaxID=1536484 RepID=A0AAN7AKM2_9PEZI|nr:hypothetical protein QBC35DRAFT_377485 [Podospora australis]